MTALAVPALSMTPAAAQAKALICEEAATACAEAAGSALRALVLTGSLARDEGTAVRQGKETVFLGDAEFLVLLHDGARLDDGLFARVGEAVERTLAARRLRAHVTLTACRPGYLRRMRPHIFACELRERGEVLRGDPDVLRLIPAFLPADLPREDAWRLLCNRLVEALDARVRARESEPMPLAADGPPEDAAVVPAAVHYAAVKVCLDMATSLLAFRGEFVPGYRARAARLAELAERGWSAGAPLPLDALAARVRECTAFKLDPEGCGAQKSWGWIEETMDWARRLCVWELAEMTGVGPDVEDEQLWARWLSQQPFSRRLRGWAQVARTQGWLRGWADRRRWLRLVWRASPRHYVYRAALALLAGTDDATDQGWEALRRQMPARAPDPGRGGDARQGLARDVAWNYHRFLVHTQS